MNCTFVITGKLSKLRADVVADIRRAGGKVVNAISGKVDYLVVGEGPDHITNKRWAAAKFDIPLLTEEQLYRFLRRKRNAVTKRKPKTNTERSVKTNKSRKSSRVSSRKSTSHNAT